jgi:hypothetical protein
MTTATEQTAVDLEALGRDAEARLAELRPQVQRLSLDALTDPRIASELDDIRSEIASAERAVEQVRLAHTEKGRRASEAAAEAAREARVVAAARVAELSAELQTAGAEVDAAFAVVCRTVEKWLALGEARDRESVAAGRRPGANAHALRAIQLDGAFRFGTRRLPMGVLGLEGFVQPRSVRALVQADVRPAEKSGRANQQNNRKDVSHV